MATDKDMQYFDQMLTALFTSQDQSKDGKLSLKELGAIVKKYDLGVDRWDFVQTCDKDGDMKMSLDEFKGYFIKTQTKLSVSPAAKELNFFSQMLEALFKAHDQGKSDGKLSIFELGDVLKQYNLGVDMFDFMKMADKDKDRKMSLEEFKKYFVEVYSKGDQAKEMELFSKMLTVIFTTCDKNKDGQLCLRELGDLVKNYDMGVDRFGFLQKCDKDGDMKMSLEEFKNYFIESHTTNSAANPELNFYSQMLEVIFVTHDKKGDGKLSIFELGDIVRKYDLGVDMFDFMKMCDEDGDRKLTLKEFKTYFIEKKKAEAK